MTINVGDTVMFDGTDEDVFVSEGSVGTVRADHTEFYNEPVFLVEFYAGFEFGDDGEALSEDDPLEQDVDASALRVL